MCRICAGFFVFFSPSRFLYVALSLSLFLHLSLSLSCSLSLSVFVVYLFFACMSLSTCMRAYACGYTCVGLMARGSYLFCCGEGVEVSWGRRLSWCELKCLRVGVAEGKQVDVTSAGSTQRCRRRQMGGRSRVWCCYV